MTEKVALREYDYSEEKDHINISSVTDIICGIIMREYENLKPDEPVDQPGEQSDGHSVGLCTMFDRHAGSLNQRSEG